MEAFYTSAEVMRLTGITARQLQYWDERGVVRPMRQGHKRFYSLDDLAEISVICDLRDRGFSLQRIRRVMRLLQREFRKRLVDTVSEHGEYHLLTDGQRIYLQSSADEIVDILKNSRQPMLAVCLSDRVRQIQASVRAKKAGQVVERESRSVSARRRRGPMPVVLAASAGKAGRTAGTRRKAS
ncbi:MAG TPA: MerR family transcriptional regulator [Terriglobales bacterium]|nr:MerR family transcriptional regulator [Terriglobales bacterium]